LEWGWQWVFPQQHRWHNSTKGERGRHQFDPSVMKKAMRKAVMASGITTPATPHFPLFLRHAFTGPRT
jgi:hypothetical protein